MSKLKKKTTNVVVPDNNRKDASKRDNMTWAIIGDKRQGKSTLIAEIAINYIERAKRQGLKKRVLIYDPSEARAFRKFKTITLEEIKKGVWRESTQRHHAWESGIRRIVDTKDLDIEELFMAMMKYMHNSMIFIDEARDIFQNAAQAPRWQKELITKHANANIDLVLVFHNLMDIHIRMRALIWVWVLFKTTEDPSSEGVRWFQVRQFPNPTQFYETWKEVDQALYDESRIIQEYRIFKKTFNQRSDGK